MDFEDSVNLLASSFLTWYRTYKGHEFRLLHRGNKCPTSKRIAKGRYARVYTLLGKAYKVMRVHDSYELRHALRELIFFNSLEHPNVLKAIKSQMVMEHGRFKRVIHELPLCDCSLGSYPLKTFAQIVRVLRELLLALQYLHSLGIVHGDVKPANIMLLNGQVKLTDFTLTTFEGRSSEMTYGTLWWRSPECALRVAYGRMSDVWSFGILALDMLHKSNYMESELHVLNNDDLLHKLGRILPDPDSSYALKDHFPRDHIKVDMIQRSRAVHMTDAELALTKDMIGHCLEWSAPKRWTCDQLLDHPLFSAPLVSASVVPSVVPLPIIWKSRLDKESIELDLTSMLGGPVPSDLVYMVRTLMDTLPPTKSIDLAVLLYNYLWLPICPGPTGHNQQSELYAIMDLLGNRIQLGSVVDFYDAET